MQLLIEGPPPSGQDDASSVLRGDAWATLLDALAVAEFTRSFFKQLESVPLSAAEVPRSALRPASFTLQAIRVRRSWSNMARSEAM